MAQSNEQGEAMTKDTTSDELRELAERYAKDFGVQYDKIRINPKGSITYRQGGGNSGGWQESGNSVNLPTWVITKHYALIKKHELDARIEVWETVQRCVNNTSGDANRLMRFNLPPVADNIAELKKQREAL